jgi:threonine/homoserine/homoserine lactone efflux protein
MSLGVLAAFWAVSFLFVITPGVDWAYAISAGMSGRVVVPAVTGMLLGHLLATIVVAAGVGAVVAKSPTALAVVTFVGAAYLLWLGGNMIARPSVPCAGDTQKSLSWGHWTIKGVGVSGLNPKVFLLFLSLLPQFTDPAARWPVALQIIALGMIHIFSCGVVYLLVGFSSKAVLQTRPRAAQAVSRASGGAMLVIAMLLLMEQVFG